MIAATKGSSYGELDVTGNGNVRKPGDWNPRIVAGCGGFGSCRVSSRSFGERRHDIIRDLSADGLWDEMNLDMVWRMRMGMVYGNINPSIIRIGQP